jgi:hypothetical protein
MASIGSNVSKQTDHPIPPYGRMQALALGHQAGTAMGQQGDQAYGVPPVYENRLMMDGVGVALSWGVVGL